ncbi:MAG: OsmC family protein [Planctomycetales bacterium]
MKPEQLRDLQAPLKASYRENPQEAKAVLRAEGVVNQEDVACTVRAGSHDAISGLHPAVGGDGTRRCSGDMLLESLAACAGVTLAAVATAMEIPIRQGKVIVEGDLDFRGTLGVSREAPVGFQEIRVRFELVTDAASDRVEKLIQLTERYCVIYQTLRGAVELKTSFQAADE